MNLSNASEILIEGKTVSSILIDGKIAYTRNMPLRLCKSNDYVQIGDTIVFTALLNEAESGECIKFYEVNDLTRTLIGSDTTDSNGEASVSYTGTGAGQLKIVAIYEDDDIESNTVIVDDYTPTTQSIALARSSGNISYGTSETFTATLVDQHGQAVIDKTVTFYEGETSLGTGTTNSSGVASLTKSNLSVGEHIVTASADSVTSTAVTVNVAKADTNLLITPPTLVYSDEFDVEGTLKNSSGTGLVDETVTLHWQVGSGTEQTATATTTTGGAYTFHRSAPTSVTTYKFWVTYAGNSNYNNSTTSEVSVTPSKETSVLNVTSPLDNSSAMLNSDLVVTGTLKDNDNTVISGAVIKFKWDGMALTGWDTTTAADGSFTQTITNLNIVEGSHTLTVYYVETSNYTGSTKDIPYTVVSYDGISILNSGDCILSYADGDSVTLSAQLLSGSSSAAVSGVSVDFYNYNDPSNPVKLNSSDVTTDGSGVASFSYVSQGSGDISVKAKVGTFLTKTFAIQDIWKYTTQEYTHTFGSSNESFAKFSQDLKFTSDDYEVELDYLQTAQNVGWGIARNSTNELKKAVLVADNGGGVRAYLKNSSGGESGINLGGTRPINTWVHMKIIKQGSTITWYNGTNSNSATNITYLDDSSEKNLIAWNWASSTAKIKNIKIKLL